MGSSLGDIFRGSQEDGKPLSTGESIGSGIIKNGIGAAGSALQPKPASPGGGGAGMAPAPSAAPVDPRFFMPTQFGQQGGMPQPQSPLYG